MLSKLNYVILTTCRDDHAYLKVFSLEWRMQVPSVQQELLLTLGIGKIGVWSGAYAVVDGKNKHLQWVTHSIHLRWGLGIRWSSFWWYIFLSVKYKDTLDD